MRIDKSEILMSSPGIGKWLESKKADFPFEDVDLRKLTQLLLNDRMEGHAGSVLAWLLPIDQTRTMCFWSLMAMIEKHMPSACHIQQEDAPAHLLPLVRKLGLLGPEHAEEIRRIKSAATLYVRALYEPLARPLLRTCAFWCAQREPIMHQVTLLEAQSAQGGTPRPPVDDQEDRGDGTPCRICNQKHRGVTVAGHAHLDRYGVGTVRLLVIGDGKREFCWRCGCQKSGWSNMANDVAEDCSDPNCVCHTAERTQ